MPPEAFEGKLAAILSADVVGYSRLVGTRVVASPLKDESVTEAQCKGEAIRRASNGI